MLDGVEQKITIPGGLRSTDYVPVLTTDTGPITSATIIKCAYYDFIDRIDLTVAVKNIGHGGQFNELFIGLPGGFTFGAGHTTAIAAAVSTGISDTGGGWKAKVQNLGGSLYTNTIRVFNFVLINFGSLNVITVTGTVWK